MVVLFNAGDQVPVIPLLEVVGNVDKVAPEQIALTCVNVWPNDTIGLITIVIVFVVAH